MNRQNLLAGLFCIITSAALGYCLGFNYGLSIEPQYANADSISWVIIVLLAAAAVVGWVLLGRSIRAVGKSLGYAIAVVTPLGGLTLIAAFFVGMEAGLQGLFENLVG